MPSLSASLEDLETDIQALLSESLFTSHPGKKTDKDNDEVEDEDKDTEEEEYEKENMFLQFR